MSRSVAATCAVFACVLSCAIGVRGAGVDGPLHWIKDPGDDPPAFNAADYTAYRHAGTATISGKIALQKPPYHDFVCGTPTLYPDTPFVQWLIEKWVSEADGKPLLKEHLTYPGDRGMGVAIPDYLDDLAPTTNKAVIDGRCENFRDYTWVRFEHVPAGTYELVEMVQRGVPYASHDSHDATIYGPFGAAPGYVETTHDGIHPADGYLMASHYGLVVRDGHSYTLTAGAVIPVAWFPNE
jgi:hypothetical protein